MRAFLAETEQKRHHPARFLVAGEFRTPVETPERIDRLAAGLKAADIAAERPADRGLAPIAAAHTPDYLQFLQTIHRRWKAIPGASDEVIPNVHPVAGMGGGRTNAPAGLAGRHMADTAAPLGDGTWTAAYWSAQTAIATAEAVAGGERAAYALCRPPGHHAFADVAGGFCFLNNCAIAAGVLQARGARRVAVLDVDVHHGNGTQGVFWRRADVLTVSIHASPDAYYPFFWGFAHEVGEGAGAGFNRNFPLPLGTADGDYMETLADAIDHVNAYAPDALVVALGLDASVDDPLKGMSLTTSGFARIGEAIGAMKLPTVLVQEGGYPSAALGENLTAALTGFAGAHG